MRFIALSTTEVPDDRIAVSVNERGAVAITPEALKDYLESPARSPKYKELDVILEIPVSDMVKMFGAVQVYELDRTFRTTANPEL